MSKNRLFFFIAFGAYHLIVFLFTLYVDRQQNDMAAMSSLREYVHLFKYGAFAGMLLFLFDFFWSWQAVASVKRKHNRVQAELDRVKAKLYDRHEENRQLDRSAITPPSRVEEPGEESQAE